MKAHWNHWHFNNTENKCLFQLNKVAESLVWKTLGTVLTISILNYLKLYREFSWIYQLLTLAKKLYSKFEQTPWRFTKKDCHFFHKMSWLSNLCYIIWISKFFQQFVEWHEESQTPKTYSLSFCQTQPNIIYRYPIWISLTICSCMISVMTSRYVSCITIHDSIKLAFSNTP